MKEELEQIVLQMYRSGLQYSGAVREFQKTFLATVLREANANQVRAAKKLGIHRNTLRRQVHELELDIKTLRSGRRRPTLKRTGCSQTENAKSGRNPFFALIDVLSRKSSFLRLFCECSPEWHAYGTKFDRRVGCYSALLAFRTITVIRSAERGRSHR